MATVIETLTQQKQALFQTIADQVQAIDNTLAALPDEVKGLEYDVYLKVKQFFEKAS